MLNTKVCKFNKEDWLQIYDYFFYPFRTNYKNQYKVFHACKEHIQEWRIA